MSASLTAQYIAALIAYKTRVIPFFFIWLFNLTNLTHFSIRILSLLLLSATLNWLSLTSSGSIIGRLIFIGITLIFKEFTVVLCFSWSFWGIVVKSTFRSLGTLLLLFSLLFLESINLLLDKALSHFLQHFNCYVESINILIDAIWEYEVSPDALAFLCGPEFQELGLYNSNILVKPIVSVIKLLRFFILCIPIRFRVTSILILVATLELVLIFFVVDISEGVRLTETYV